MAIDTVVLQANLDDARLQYHSLVTGRMARVIVDQNGERVEFTATRKGELAAYIRDLEALLNPAVAVPLTGPIGFIF